jgi:hypothetical protein
MKKLLLIVATSLLLSSGMVNAASKADAEAAINAAKASLDKADAAGFEWRDSRKLLKKAESITKKGEYDKAVKLANQAKQQGDAAIKQAASQKNAGPLF